MAFKWLTKQHWESSRLAASLASRLLGTDAKQKVRLQRTLSAAVAFILVLLAQVALALAGMTDRYQAATLSGFIALGMSFFYAAIRSGWSLRFRDPALTLAQMVFGISSLAWAYAINPQVRGLVPMMMTLVLSFGAFILPPRRCRQLGYFSVLVLVCVSIACMLTWPQDFALRIEAFHLLLSSIVLTAMGYLAGQLSALRQKQKKQSLELQSAVENILQMATHDELTGLPNRRHVKEKLGKLLSQAKWGRSNGAVLQLDIDNFQGFNDTFGHGYGDELLRAVARRLSDTMGAEDNLARLGGDEFVLLLPVLDADESKAIAQAQNFARSVLQAFHAPFELSLVHHQCTASVGIAYFGQEHLSADELLKRADLALYQAKNGGRNTFRSFDPEIQTSVIARTEMEAQLRRGIAQQEFILHYQPQVNADGVTVGAEALVRWKNPQWGMVSPANFIPLAEETGLIIPLGNWVLEAACRQLKQWVADPQCGIQSVSVNVSARQFLDAHFVEQVLGTLERTQAPAQALKLELTESMMVTDSDLIIEKMNRLREHGLCFSLDDFGTGYSSLTYLRKLPLSQLKIDQSFLKEVLTNPKDAAIIRVVIGLGASLGMTVIAEGVETHEQWELLLREGCSNFQGYLFGRPCPPGELHFGPDSGKPRATLQAA